MTSSEGALGIALDLLAGYASSLALELAIDAAGELEEEEAAAQLRYLRKAKEKGHLG